MKRSRATRRSALAAALVAGLLPVGPARAQAPINTSALVLDGNIGVEAQRDLDFGDILPGGIYDIAITSVRSGRWRVTGQVGAEVRLSFVLPSILSSGPSDMPITFGPNQAGHFPFNLPNLATLFDPNVGATATLFFSLNGRLFVWLGGTVSPGAAQPSGVYTGLATLVVAYTGN